MHVADACEDRSADGWPITAAPCPLCYRSWQRRVSEKCSLVAAVVARNSSFARNSRTRVLSIQRWTISIRARFPLKILVQCNFITLFLIVQNLYSGWDDDWRVIVVRFVHFYFIAIFCFTSIQEQRRNRIDIHRVQTIYVNDREREKKKRCSIQKCANTEFSLSLSLSY